MCIDSGGGDHDVNFSVSDGFDPTGDFSFVVNTRERLLALVCLWRQLVLRQPPGNDSGVRNFSVD